MPPNARRSQYYIKWEIYIYPFFEILIYCLATSDDLPPQSISVPSVIYIIVFYLNGFFMFQTN